MSMCGSRQRERERALLDYLTVLHHGECVTILYLCRKTTCLNWSPLEGWPRQAFLCGTSRHYHFSLMVPVRRVNVNCKKEESISCDQAVTTSLHFAVLLIHIREMVLLLASRWERFCFLVKCVPCPSADTRSGGWGVERRILSEAILGSFTQIDRPTGF